ncbi:MAG: hypothetical protein HRU41_40140 [Saprospiraceae bacterium]|nr:hypothetical protein [Saprospiraceae bacterium]
MKTLSKTTNLYPILSGLLLLSSSIVAQQNSIFDIINYQEVIKINLSFDLSSLQENRRNKEAYPGRLNFTDQRGEPQSWEVDMSLRGKFRRQRCQEMPPLTIDFSKKDLTEAGLAPFDDLKLVTYCMDNDQAAREALIREYITYKLYNQLTAISFRVQLVKMTIEDTRSGKKITQMAFLIEDTAQLRARLGATKVEGIRVRNKMEFQPHPLRLTTLFQYMIGNQDWGLTISKNIKYLMRAGKVIIVPYDFDFSALVGASYAMPPKESLDKPLTYGRAYLGFEEEEEDLRVIFNEMRNKRKELLLVIRKCRYLRASVKKEMEAYINFFFEHYKDLDFSRTL